MGQEIGASRLPSTTFLLPSDSGLYMVVFP